MADQVVQLRNSVTDGWGKPLAMQGDYAKVVEDQGKVLTVATERRSFRIARTLLQYVGDVEVFPFRVPSGNELLPMATVPVRRQRVGR